MTGMIKRIVENRYFGFIKADLSQTEYFFHREDFSGHWDDLIKDFNSKESIIPVSFDIGNSPKGPRAAHVKRLDYPNDAA